MLSILVLLYSNGKILDGAPHHALVDMRLLTPTFLFSSLLLAFTPTSDAKQLEFYEDRGSKFIKDETKSIKNKNLKGTVVPEHVPDGNLTVENNVEELKNNLAAIAHSPEALTSDFPRCASSAGAGLKGEKDGNQVPIAVESSPKTADGAASLLENNVPVKEEVWLY